MKSRQVAELGVILKDIPGYNRTAPGFPVSGRSRHMTMRKADYT